MSEDVYNVIVTVWRHSEYNLPFYYFISTYVMNLKNKLFAAFTASSVVLSSFAPVSFVAANYTSAELAENTAAYEWAFDKELTTMSSMNTFMWENAITREQAARFLVKGSKALDIDLSSDQSCDYKDLASADQSLVEFINESCEMGIFKAQADFNPTQLLTREQAELVVARVVYGFDEVAAYAADAGITDFAAARDLLMADEIVKVELPGQSAVRRGHLLLMLYRLADADIDPSTPSNPGHAEVSLVSAAANQNVPYNANGVKVGTIKLTAGANPTTVSSVTVVREGLGNVSDLQGAWLANANTVTDVKSFSTSSQSATVKFSPSLKLAAGESVNFDVLVALSGAVNSQHAFKVTSVNVSNGTASGAPVKLGSLSTTSYKVSDVNVNVEHSGTYQSGKTNEKFATVKVTPTKEATLNKVVVTADSSEDLPKVFSNVKAYYKGNAVGTVSVSDDKIVVEGLNIAALSNETINLELKGDIIYVGASLNVKLNAGLANNANTSVIAIEKNSNYGMPVKDTTSSAGIIIAGIDLKITKTTTGSLTVNPGASNVTLFEGEITSASDFEATEFSLKPSADYTLYTGFTDNKITLYVAGDDYELNMSGTVTGASYTYNATSGYYFQSNGTKFSVDAGQKVKIKVVGSLYSNANTGDFKFTFGINKIKNVDNNSTMTTSVSRAGDTVRVREGSSVVKTATVAAPTTRTLYSDAEQEIGRFAVKATDDALTLKELVLVNSGTITPATETLEDLISNVKLVNVADGKEINSSVTLSGNEIKFTGISSTLAKDTDVNIKLVANTNTFETSAVSGNVQLKFAANGIKATRNSDGNDANVSGLTTVNFVSYKIGVQPPKVTLAKIDANKFKVTFKNVDTENDYSLSGFEARVQTKADNNSNYTGTICLDIDGSAASSCTNVANISSTGSVGPVKYFALNGTDAVVNLTKDGGEISYTILVDSTFIEPDLLRASVLKVNYNGTSENYSVTAQ